MCVCVCVCACILCVRAYVCLYISMKDYHKFMYFNRNSPLIMTGCHA